MRPILPALLLVSTPATSTAEASEPLDGVWVTVGPVAGAVLVEDETVSGVGLELSVLHVAERRFPASIGGCVGGVSYGGRSGGRLWLEAEASTGAPLPIGLGLGVAAEVDHNVPVRLGGQATLWIFTGIVPYARAGVLSQTGPFFEAGVMLKVPARRFP